MRDLINWSETDKKVVTVCPYCASGCKINLVMSDNGKIVRAEAARENQPSTLCLKGYYGWDFINDTQSLTRAPENPQ
ncbi:hypothetical protein ACNKHT_27065 [Shigella flexneri]